jgi:hypothetical protein
MLRVSLQETPLRVPCGQDPRVIDVAYQQYCAYMAALLGPEPEPEPEPAAELAPALPVHASTPAPAPVAQAASITVAGDIPQLHSHGYGTGRGIPMGAIGSIPEPMSPFDALAHGQIHVEQRPAVPAAPRAQEGIEPSLEDGCWTWQQQQQREEGGLMQQPAATAADLDALERFKLQGTLTLNVFLCPCWAEGPAVW